MRSEICKGCCPSGGALFDVVISQAAWDSEAPLSGADYVKRCRNCMTEKPLRTRRSAKRDARNARHQALIAELLTEED
jgi:hypothetical protein